ncbi:MAG: LysR family transcriptional regulator [Oscillospiraceae bacterium]|nr:LysR family transcriptional regulator [Oscillospiraceae bacterium]
MSLAIHELEEYYGVALFDRIGRRLRACPATRRW